LNLSYILICLYLL